MSRDQVLREIPLEEIEGQEYAALAKMFNHAIVEAADGRWLWRRNQLVDLLVHSQDTRFKVGMNDLRAAFHQGLFSVEELMKFYMQMGVSLSHFSEVFCQREASEWDLPGATPVPPEHDGNTYVETVVDYVLRINAGRILQL